MTVRYIILSCDHQVAAVIRCTLNIRESSMVTQQADVAFF